MNDLPDAPWIRDAEMNGIPEVDDFCCPVCGEENPETLYIVGKTEIIGCCECIKAVDGWQWVSDHGID